MSRASCHGCAYDVVVGSAGYVEEGGDPGIVLWGWNNKCERRGWVWILVSVPNLNGVVE